MSQVIIEDLYFCVDETMHQCDLAGGVSGVAVGTASGATGQVILAGINPPPTGANAGGGTGGAASGAAAAAISVTGLPRAAVGTGAIVLVF